MSRIDGRAPQKLRPVSITPGVSPYAEGSAEVSFGKTKLLVTASLLREIPKWMKPEDGGWITAEYGMLPRSTHTRNRREAAAGKQGGRTLEIQRLVGRALRAAVDLKALGPVTIQLDCDVLVADGGTRTAAISGGWVALYQAIAWGKTQGIIPSALEISNIGAVSVGMVSGRALLDLCYEEDSCAEFDLNLVFNNQGQVIEVQGTAEKGPVEPKALSGLIELGLAGVEEIFTIQQNAVAKLER